MKKISLITILVLLCGAGFAQVTVSGNVTDLSQQPLSNKTVSVYTDSVPNQQIFWGQDISNANGDYTILLGNIPANGTLFHIYIYDCNNNVVEDTVTYTGGNIVQDFSICSVALPPTTIAGTITASNVAIGEPDAIVYLIEMSVDSLTNDTTLTAIDSAYTDSVGHYSLSYPNYWAPKFMVKAGLLPANANYGNYLPTYYTSSLVWSGASGLPNPLPVNGVNIQLVAGINPGGPAFIGGDVTQGANKSTAVGDPLPNKILILTDINDQAIAYTYTDAAGHFSFSNLPYGDYKLFGDVGGKQNPPLIVSLSAVQDSVTNIEFQEHQHLFEGHYIMATSVGSAPATLKSAVVFPNPVSDMINVAGMNNVQGAKNVSLSAINGAVIYTHRFAENEAIRIPAASLSKGIYMLHINTNEGNLIFKISK